MLNNATAKFVLPNLMPNTSKTMWNANSPLAEHTSDRIVRTELPNAALAAYALLLHEHIRMTQAKTYVAVRPLLF